MRVIKTWCENTKEGYEYLTYNGYYPICRLTKTLWIVFKIGNTLKDVEVIV